MERGRSQTICVGARLERLSQAMLMLTHRRRTYSDADQGEEIREGHDPSSMLPDQEQQEHAANRISGAVPEGEDEVDDDDDDKEGDGDLKTGMSYGSLNEERTAWGDGGDRST